MREKHPDEKSLTFFAPLVKSKWDIISDDDKEKYIAMNEAEKVRY